MVVFFNYPAQTRIQKLLTDKSFSLYIEDLIKLNIFDDNQLCFISE